MGVTLECGQVCEYDVVVTILIRFHLIALYFGRREGDIPSEADALMLLWRNKQPQCELTAHQSSGN